MKPTLNKIIKYSENEYSDKYRYPQISIINHKLSSLDEIKSSLIKIVHDILNEYDFIRLVEQLDESLVILRLLLRLNTGDVLYLSSKTHKK